MSEANEILAIARDWVRKGENDLKNATHTLGMRKDCPTDYSMFPCSTMCRKIFKGLFGFKEN
jgi:hypothetical protein